MTTAAIQRMKILTLNNAKMHPLIFTVRSSFSSVPVMNYAIIFAFFFFFSFVCYMICMSYVHADSCIIAFGSNCCVLSYICILDHALNCAFVFESIKPVL